MSEFNPNEFFDDNLVAELRAQAGQANGQAGADQPGSDFSEHFAELDQDLFEVLRVLADSLEERAGPIWHYPDREVQAISRLGAVVLKKYLPVLLAGFTAEAALAALVASGLSRRMIAQRRADMAEAA